MSAKLSPARDQLLFTPGPLTTSLSVKEAMLHDAGSWHEDFNRVVADIRERLLGIAGVSRESGWESILLQGSGTFAVEAVFQTCVPHDGKVAVMTNGAYGDRMIDMLRMARIDHTVLRRAEHEPILPADVDQLLSSEPSVTHVALVHCETTTGILNPLQEIGPVVRKHKKVLIVDAMSSFGGIPIDLEACGVDFLVSSANKCLEGVPGFAFVLCRRAILERSAGTARSLSLDLLGQLRGFEKNGQFRFTPPTHTLLAFQQALKELDLEGGIRARADRYRLNHEVLMSGTGRLGLRAFLPPLVQSNIITAFHYPDTPRFSFPGLYQGLSDRGFIIYPGKLTRVNTFRIGTIGRLFPADIEQLVHAMRLCLEEMR